MKIKITMFIAIGMLFGQVDYESQVQTILNNSCATSCHVNGGGYHGNLDLSSYDNLMAGDSNNGPVVEAEVNQTISNGKKFNIGPSQHEENN